MKQTNQGLFKNSRTKGFCHHSSARGLGHQDQGRQNGKPWNARSKKAVVPENAEEAISVIQRFTGLRGLDPFE